MPRPPLRQTSAATSSQVDGLAADRDAARHSASFSDCAKKSVGLTTATSANAGLRADRHRPGDLQERSLEVAAIVDGDRRVPAAPVMARFSTISPSPASSCTTAGVADRSPGRDRQIRDVLVELSAPTGAA